MFGLQEEIGKQVEQAGIFAVVMDESPDVSRTEQLSLIVRYVDLSKPKEPVVRERFLGISAISSQTGEALAEEVGDR